MKLKKNKTVVGPSFFFLNDDDVVSCKDDKRSCASWGGKIGEKGGYIFMGDQASQELFKSRHILKDGSKIIKWW